MPKTLTKGLTRAQVKRFRKLLDAKAAEIRDNLQSSAAAKTLAHGGEPLNLEELPGQSHEEWIFLNRNNIDVMLLREIEDAVERIEVDDYGICLECDEPISLKRLEAVSWARHCVPCQEELAADEGGPQVRRPFR